MIIAPASVLDLVETTVATAAQALVDQNGQRIALSTISHSALRSAALIALQIAVGDAVWPADRPIRLPRAQRYAGAVQIQEEN